MKTASTVAPVTGPNALLAVDGRIVAALGVAVAILFATAARVSPAAFGLLAAAGVALVAYAAMRWPLPTLVLSALVSVLDLEVTPRLLPEVFGGGPIGLSEPMLAVAGLAIAVGAARRGTLWGALRDPVLPLVGLFIGLAILSAVVNATPPIVALLGILMTVDAIAIYFTVRMVRLDERRAAVAIAIIVLGAVAVAMFGLAQALIDPDLLGLNAVRGNYGEGRRITSVLGHPNMLAAVIGLSLPFALFGSLHLEGARWRWIARAALFVLLCALLLTFSRGAWLAVGLGGLIGGLLLDWRSVPLLLLTVALAWGAVTVMPRDIAVATESGPSGQTDGVGNGGNDGNGANAGNNGGGRGGSSTDGEGGGGSSIIDSTLERLGHLGTRARYLRDGLPIILDHPFLGVGPGRYGGAAAAIIPSPVYEQYDTKLFGYRTVHSFWQHLIGESGALGVAVFLTLVLGLLIRFVRAARAATGTHFVILASAATMLLVAGFHSFSEMIFEGNMPVVIVWLIVGIASTLAPVRPLFAEPVAARAIGRVVGDADSGAAPVHD